MKVLALASVLAIGLIFTGSAQASGTVYNSKTTQNVSSTLSSGGAFDGTYLSSKGGSGLSNPSAGSIRNNFGYVETVHISYDGDKMFVKGWLKPHFWSNSKIYFRADVKDATGKIIASKIGYAYPTGRPQVVVQFGVWYGISFESAQVTHARAIEVRLIN